MTSLFTGSCIELSMAKRDQIDYTIYNIEHISPDSNEQLTYWVNF